MIYLKNKLRAVSLFVFSVVMLQQATAGELTHGNYADLVAKLKAHPAVFELHRCLVDVKLLPNQLDCTVAGCGFKLMVYAEDRAHSRPGAISSFVVRSEDLYGDQATVSQPFFKLERSWTFEGARYYQTLALTFNKKNKLEKLDLYEGRSSVPVIRRRTQCQNI